MSRTSNMLICDICTQEVSSVEDMKSHMLLAHVEHEVSCPLCTFSGLTYDELHFHMQTAHEDMLNNWDKDVNQCDDVVQQKVSGSNVSGDTTASDLFAEASERHNDHMQYDNSLQGFREDENELSEGDFCNSSLSDSSSCTVSSSSNSDFMANASCSSSVVCIPNSGSVKEKSEACELQFDLGASASVTQDDVTMLPECPFCCEIKPSFEELEFHVRTEHADLVDTPTKDCKKYECPMCSLVCASCQILEEHVNLHLEEGSRNEDLAANACSDLYLAKQLQCEEDKRRRAEESQKEKEEFQKLQKQFGMDNSGGYKEQSLQNLERAVARGRVQPMEFHLQRVQMMETLATGVDDGRTKTSGVLDALCRYYNNSAPEVNCVWLCSNLDHFSNSPGDKGWGCGFRNFQMILSSLLHNDTFKNSLQEYRSIPCIPKIQSLIEKAWKEGFDPQGASHFNGRLQGTKAWIGACEIYCLLTSLEIKCQILDFHKPSSPSGTHPLLFEWIQNFYSSGDSCSNGRVICTSKPAIYLQHQGHSRTIVGIEERKNKSYCLLIFDPGCPVESMRKLLRQNIDGTALKSLRKYIGSLKHKQYQIVAVDGVLSAEEKAVRLQMTKAFRAEKIP
ncbi:zinc finger with UFM1-specific peptidase domain [Pelobates cultripes]|uniref:Zinc finger-containing ubiquitin peptidase 1 n=1 Tax=Pelobates cultripes TaxID=61616 RepID=A0AAD1RFE0_PELCU|nr:zinc finger with UFM1-specific peptidase domain [Pelobates cultripes]